MEKRARVEVVHAHESGPRAGGEVDTRLTQGQYYTGSQQRMHWQGGSSQAYGENGYHAQQRMPWQVNNNEYPTQHGGGWRGGQSSQPIPFRGHLAHPIRPPGMMQGPPRPQHQEDFAYMREIVYLDHNGHEVQPLSHMQLHDEGDQSGYDRANAGYHNSQTSGGAVGPLQGVAPNMARAYLMADTQQKVVAAAGVVNPTSSSTPSPHHVPSIDSFKPEMHRVRDSAHPENKTHTPEIAKSSSSTIKQRRDVQHVYEAEEADRKARGLKPHVIECNSLGAPEESGRAGSRFLEVLKAFCMVYLDVSIIKVKAQDPIAYASLREHVEAEFEFTSHNISDVGFKKVVSKCMKVERSRLHRLYTTKPDRECPPTEDPRVWETLKEYWRSTSFEKVSKVRKSDMF